MKTIAEINQKIKKGEVVVVTAEEIIDLVEKKGLKKAAQEVDVVTTGTFGPMCSSGAYFNIGHSKPKIKIGGGACRLNDVPVYTGFAAMDIYLGATALPDDDPLNKVYPGEFRYGGGHVIQELLEGKDIRLEATAYGTDCYPRKKLDTYISLKDLNEAVLFNLRNCYQNYNVAVNLSDRILYTYMGVLKPNCGNANYCSAGQLSPLLNDPYYKTIGIGTRIFLGGGIGYVAWQGTQHNPNVKRKDNGVPFAPGGTLAVIGDLKQMESQWLRGTSMLGYGVTLSVGIGVPIPVLNEEIAQFCAVKDEEIYAYIIDYSQAYPQGMPGTLGEVNYKQLKSGKINLQGKEISTGALSSYSKAKEIAEELKSWIKKGDFLLSDPVAPLPGVESGYSFKPLKERLIK
ncbi:MAG: homocysteine biosynthesis protein [Candidatus Omnitrophota bacterium]|nr:homocysteine biosynthesis protein [Candidatus Omnitrophota bacterium]MBU2035102.1 homocysteine biosynthesis protein [Candidatus Omnitrophota bacterium]MBU2221383.1 homocysteine biosynthesis protein [Candidatus Omnitrophota bacterium]MBU2257861.1 homocysteine biosynthesis protein [Candidatus Omnitrophota bacterium]